MTDGIILDRSLLTLESEGALAAKEVAKQISSVVEGSDGISSSTSA